MKALLVADSEKAIDNIGEVLKTAGYDTIVYRWLLKALDNMAEIAPHLIVVSTRDYPRHWKTLAQYATGSISSYTPELILYTDEHFSEEEKKKAEALNVRGFFSSIDVDGLDELRAILRKHTDIFSGALTEQTDGETEISVAEIIGSTDSDSFPQETDTPTVSDVLAHDMNFPAIALPGADTIEKIISDEISDSSLLPAAQAISEDTFRPAPPSVQDDSEKSTEETSPNSEEGIEENKSADILENVNTNSKNGENNMADVSIEDKLAEIMGANKADAEEKAMRLNIPTNSCSFVFTNPITLAMVSGTARNYNGMTLEFTPDIPSFILNLTAGTKIETASLKCGTKIESVLAQVMSNDATKLYIQIKK